MPDGTVMRRAVQVRRSVDAERARPVLRAAGIDPATVEKVKRSISIAAVERAAAGLAPPSRKRADVAARKAAVEQVLRSLETSGGLKISSFEQWEVEGAHEPAALPENNEVSE
jgi:hypothetical protein